MKRDKLTILMVVEQCNPDWASVPLLAYHTVSHVAKQNGTRVILITHERNKKGLSQSNVDRTIFIPESKFEKAYYKLISSLTQFHSKRIWPLYHLLNYPLFYAFQYRADRHAKKLVDSKAIDLIHVFTPILPRYGYKLSRLSKAIPIVLGPVNGGLAFPKGFKRKAQSEFSFFNSFRALAKFLPYYKKSYQKASLVLAGSKDTYRFLAKSIPLNERRLRLYHENGVDDSFFQSKTKKKDKKTLSLLFIGRLVPYKCCDILIRAIHAVPKDIKPVIECTIVGDGSEKNRLKRLIKTCRLENQITMTGWVDQNETRQFYSQADLFCFPSIREFGGAVVLEAQAHGLPCLVTNHGGISEYVEDQKTGYKINASSYQDMVNGFSKKITELFYDREKLSYLSRQAHDHAKQWEWSEKAQQLYKIYHQCIQGQYDE